MNPVLILLIILGVAILWFLLSFLFRPLGKMVHRIYKDAADEMIGNNKNKEENKNE